MFSRYNDVNSYFNYCIVMFCYSGFTYLRDPWAVLGLLVSFVFLQTSDPMPSC